VTGSNRKAAKEFLSLLFNGGGAVWVDVRAIKPDANNPKRIPCRTMDQALDAIAKHEAVNVYVGVASRATGSTAPLAGGKTNLLATRALWVDVDGLPPGNDREEYLGKTLEGFRLPPSFVVDSGGGLHLYWLLEEPTSLATEEERDHLECILRGLCDVLDGDSSATDSPRILRIPGTTNYPDANKRAKGRTVVPCTMLRGDNGHQYQLEDFDDLAERGKKHHAGKGAPVELDTDWDGKLPASVGAALKQKRNKKLRAQWDATDAKGDRASELDMSVANLLAIAGVEANDIGHALRFRRERTGAKWKRAGYYELTVGNAVAWAEAEREKEKSVPKLQAIEGGKAEPPEYDGSEQGVAKWTIRKHGDDLIYHPSAGWLVWDGTRFARDSKDAHRVKMITSGAADELFQSSKAMQAAGRGREAGDIAKEAAKATRARTLRDAVSQLEYAPEGGDYQPGDLPELWVHPNGLDAAPYSFNVANGTLRLSKDEAILEPHKRSDHITRIAPHEYDPQAACPRWLAWLEEFQPDEETRRYLQKLAGQSLLAEPNKFVLAIHYGMGANGKSTFVNIVRSVIGDEYAVEASSDLLTYSGNQSRELANQVVNLPGARLAVTSEPAEGCRLNSSAVKRITSGDPMQGRWLYKEAFPFVPVCTVMMTTNHMPVISETDDGIWRRVHLIPWEVAIDPAKMDRRFHLNLVEAEGPGILRWMVEGAQAYLAEGLVLPEHLAEATEDYRQEADEVGAFLSDWCVLGDAEVLSEAGSVMHKAFLAWALDNGGDTKLANNSFAGRMKSHRLSKGKGRNRRRWIGVQLTPAAYEVLEQHRR